MGATPLPDAVYRDLVDMLFGMRLPIIGLALVFIGVTGLIAFSWGDTLSALLGVAAIAVTAIRLGTIAAYHRAVPIAVKEIEAWERRYAFGNYAFGLLLGLLSIRALMFHQPLLHLITVSLVFSFGAGVVSRISIRPVICVISLLLATIPTIVGLAAHAFTHDALPLHTELFLIEAFLVAMVTALSLQTVAHLYRSAVLHLTGEHDMAHLAKRDDLTGLANRLLLRDAFRAASLDATQPNNRLAIHYIDLDGFKGVNDVHGHPAGDAVLQVVSRRLEAIVRAGDTVARLGGDEFIVLQVGLVHPSEAEMLARRIIKKLSVPYEVDGQLMTISASVGIAMTPQIASDLDGLISCADAALYRSKSGGKGRLHFCDNKDAIRPGVMAA